VSIVFYGVALFAAVISLLTQDVITLAVALIAAALGIMTEGGR
jgi:hypothetical protein